MKTTKDMVYEFIQKTLYTSSDYKEGIPTHVIAEALGMQRSNVSALLNKLVKEGLLVKQETRPVYYRLKDAESNAQSMADFTHLIGHHDSLRNAIQLAKAAILYPKSSLNVLILSKPGCGATYFAASMYQFAVARGIISQDAPCIKVSCKNYSKDMLALNAVLFGVHDDLQDSCFSRAQNGMLFIDNYDLLDATQQSRILDLLETGWNPSENTLPHNIIVVLSCSPQSGLQISRKIPVTLELPELKDRSLQERFEFINHFFAIEAANSEKTIIVPSETIKALLLTDFMYNIKELELEIKSACASAYVRIVDNSNQDLCVYMNDFKPHIKKGLLRIRKDEETITALLGSSETIIYDSHQGYQAQDESGMYSEIKKQYDELTDRGINPSSIRNVMNTHIRNLFKKYRYYNALDDSSNLEQLAKIVDHQIIELVRTWLESCKHEWGRTFKSNVFYGLCLHINALLSSGEKQQRMDNEQIVKLIQDYPQEYSESVQFSKVLNRELGLVLTVEEVMLIMMFLIESDEDEANGHPVLLYVMHGHGSAASLKNVTNMLTQSNNTYSYDLLLDMEPKQAMAELRNLILEIDQGYGVIVIYDMGSIKTMLETIAEEIEVKIRLLNIPITLVGIDIARKCSMETDIDYVYHIANMELNTLNRTADTYNTIIVTLCHTGEGGALQLKRYIDQYSKSKMKIVPLAISQRDTLLKEVTALRKSYHVHAFVGTYDPKLFGIPFIPIGKIFENTPDDLDRILMFEPVSSHFFDYTEVYRYLEDQFKYVSIPKLKSVLPAVIDAFNVLYALSEDQRIGLFMHIACLLERLLEGKRFQSSKEMDKINDLFAEDYIQISKILKDLEKTFKVIINDHEIAILIMIIKRV